MDAERYEQVNRIFTAARKLEGAARAAYLDESCGSDADLREQVEALLARLEGGAGAIATAAGRSALARHAANLIDDDEEASPPEPLPERIGPFRILQVLGEGGMGVVYEAEQTEPVSRRVALKVVKLGMDAKDLIARFEAERQALAVMDHPGIAHVHDAGTTEGGRPWFAMELVKGLPLTEYCDSQELSTRQRLELFAELCSAVQHAHQKGIIHRDLKPSNVLVTEVDGRPVPKIIDFGIAKALTGSLTDKTLVTQLGQALGTPAYMAPEQARASKLDVDTRADVYALGVMLFELLVGCLPFEEYQAWDELLRSLAEGRHDTPTPSRRFAGLPGERRSAVAQRRRADVHALESELKSDLDWIVHVAMDPVRSRRYETANGLAADVRRYLADEPVVARPPTVGYRVRKFCKRHALGVTVATVVAALLVVFGIGMGVLWRRSEANLRLAELNLKRAELAESDARVEATTAERTIDFLLRLFEGANPFSNGGKEPTVRDMLDAGVASLKAGELEELPLVRARLLSALGKINAELGRFELSDELLREALELQRKAGEELQAAGTLAYLGALASERRMAPEAAALLEEALAIHERLLGPDAAPVGIAYLNLGVLAQNGGDPALARERLERALAILEPTDERAALAARVGLCLALTGVGEPERALEVGEAALGDVEAVEGADSPRMAFLLQMLALAHDSLGHAEEALELRRRRVRILDAALGPVHPVLATALHDLAFTESDADLQVDLHRRSLDIRVAVFGEEAEEPMRSREALAWALAAKWGGREESDPEAARAALAEAEALHRSVLDWRTREQGPLGVRTIISRRALANLLAQAGRQEEAVVLLRALLDEHPRGGDSEHNYRETRDNLASALRAAGRSEEADALLAEGDEH